MKFWEIEISLKNSRKLQDSSIFRFQIFKFSMLTHVCGVARGPLPHAIAAHMRQHGKFEYLKSKDHS